MKKILATVAILAAALSAASAQVTTNQIYITTNDFGQFSGGSISTSFFSVSGTTNGIGNSSTPGATGGVGSYQFLTQVGGGYGGGVGFTYPTPAVWNDISAGSSSTNITAGSGTLTFDIDTASIPSTNSIGFFLNINSPGQYQNFNPTSTTSFTGADGNTWINYVIPYTTTAQPSPGYFGWGVLQYAGNDPGNEAVYIDNINILTAAVPEPGTYALTIMGLLGVVVMIRRRRLQA